LLRPLLLGLALPSAAMPRRAPEGASPQNRACRSRRRGGGTGPPPSPLRRVFVGKSVPLRVRAMAGCIAGPRSRVRPPARSSRLWPSGRACVNEVETRTPSPGSGRGSRAVFLAPPGCAMQNPLGPPAVCRCRPRFFVCPASCSDAPFLPPLGTSVVPLLCPLGWVAASIPC
jgi:hypothetical protein